MSTLADFVAGLKAHLKLESANLVCGTEFDTEMGFVGANELDIDRLDAEIDKFAASFVEAKK